MNTQSISASRPDRPVPPVFDRPVPPGDFELRFESLFVGARGMAFPCDAKGRVDLDALSERARHNYFYARTLMGREFAFPVVRCCTLQ